MSWPVVVEVVIGLVFFFWLVSVLASAINEAIANLFRMRAHGLEKGIKSMLGDEHVETFFQTAIVLSQRKPGTNRKPSYLDRSIFTDALQELFGVEGTSFRLDLSNVANDHLRTRLEQFAAKVGNDATQFRKELETWFDNTMDRASGWYKRRSHLILFIIGLVVAGVANMSPVTIGQRLWNDASFRSIVNAEAADAIASATPTTTSATPTTTTTTLVAPAGGVSPPATQSTTTTSTTVAAGPLQRAESEYRRIHQLNLPAGWGADNQPKGAGWWAAILGWLITAFAVTLGAPFWFDVLNKVSRLRTAGPVTPPPAPGDASKAADIKNGSTTASPSPPPVPSGPAITNRMKPAERAIVIVSATSISGKTNFSRLYRALDVAGPTIATAQLRNTYATIIPLTREQCTRARIVKALADAAANVAAVDLILMVHGEPDQLILSDGTETGSEEVAAFDLAKDIHGNAELTGKLRLCYSTACYGQTHADSLLGAGFLAVIGAKGVNSNSGTELPLLLQRWSHGDTIADALKHADDPILRAIADTIARRSFQNVNSEKVLVGDGTITIDSRPTPAAPADAANLRHAT